LDELTLDLACLRPDARKEIHRLTRCLLDRLQSLSGCGDEKRDVHFCRKSKPGQVARTPGMSKSCPFTVFHTARLISRIM
jgi:hypothetical protein